MSDKFCKDCMHSRGSEDGNPYNMKCQSPNNAVPSQDEAKFLVSGIEQPVIIAVRGGSCMTLRTQRDAATLLLVCGPEGTWFEAKK